MQLFKLYFSPALLLVLLTSHLWQVGQSLPVIGKGQLSDSCGSDAWELLESIGETLNQTHLFTGINCTTQSVELNTQTNTPFVCAPKTSTCSGTAMGEFDQDSCLMNIGDDLLHYYKFLAAQPNADSLVGLSLRLRNLMENCFALSVPVDKVSKGAAADRPSNYDERLKLCKVLKGFQVRTITINRVIAYMSSGEHTK